MQYLYGLARAGRPQADALLACVRRFAARAPEFNRAAWAEVALHGCEGLYSYARGDYERTWQQLGIAMPRMTEVGGSHAQRDLFEQVLIDAAFKSGRAVAAQQMLEARRRNDPNGAPVNAALAEVYSALSLPALADQARQRAALTRTRHSAVA
jgi:hypothetical protein